MRVILALSYFAIVSLSSACSERQKIPTAFVGTWQSDEPLTLASLRKSETVSPSDRETFTNDFFGERVMVFQLDRAKSYWVGEDWVGVEQDDTWYKYDIVASGPDFMTLRAPLETTTWRVEGDLIYAELPKWDFREYYRRIDDYE